MEAPQAETPKKRGVLLIVIIAAVALLGLGVCVLGILATLLMPALLKAKQKAATTKCANNLRQIGLAAIQYADEKKGFPHDPTDPDGKKALELLLSSGYLDDRDVLHCPASDDPSAGYAGFVVPLSLNASASTPLAWDAQPHPDGRRNVVFADGHAALVSEMELESLLAKLRAARPR